MDGMDGMDGIPPQLGDNDVRDLFAKHSVAELRSLERVFRTQADGKKEELRTLVGNRYRDLVDSADHIVAMDEAADELETIKQKLDSLASLQRRLSALYQQPVPEGSRSAPRSEQLHAAAAQLKCLVEAPGKIWGALQEHRCLDAAHLYIAGSRLDRHVSDIQSDISEIQGFSGMISRVRTRLSQLPGEIVKRSRTRLRTDGLSAPNYAEALAALVFIEKLQGNEALDEFLLGRVALVRCAALPPLSIVDVVQDTLIHVASIFTGNEPILHQILQNTVGNTVCTRMLSLREQSINAFVECVTNVVNDASDGAMNECSVNDLHVVCNRWLEYVSKWIQNNAAGLFARLESPTEIGEAECEIKQRCESPVNATAEHWSSVTNTVVDHDVMVWPLLFKSLLVDRGVAVIQQLFDKLSLDGFCTVMASVSKDTRGPDHLYGKSLWDSVDVAEPAFNKYSRPHGRTPKMDTVVRDIETQLLQIVADARPLLVDDDVSQLLECVRSCARDAILSRVIPALSNHGDSINAALFAARVAKALGQSKILHGILTVDKLMDLCEPSNKIDDDVSSAFDEVFSSGHLAWGEALSINLCNELKVRLDVELNVPESDRKQLWQSVLVEENERAPLPTEPSPALMWFLFAACSEMHRIGSHLLPQAIKTKIVELLRKSVVDAYLQASESTESEVNQLWLCYDVRFLIRHMGQDNFEAVSKAIETKLDPIDLALFGTHIKAAVQKQSMRTAALLGAFGLVQWSGSASRSDRVSDRHVYLYTVKVASRVPLLPIGNLEEVDPMTPVRPRQSKNESDVLGDVLSVFGFD